MIITKHIRKTVILGAVLSSIAISNNAFAATYQVKNGDTLWKISQNNNTTVQQLKSLNQLSSNVIYAGQNLEINSTKKTYIVKSGDDLNSIANKFHTTVTNLLNLNPSITHPNYIYVGQAIKVVGVASASKTYTVQSGDSLSKIAKDYGVSYQSLISANPQINNPSVIQIGQVINIPTTGSVAEAAPAKSSTSSVDAATKINKVINEGEKYIGAKYLYGASTNQTNAFDCSSLTKRAFSAVGIDLPRVSRDQAKVGIPVSRSTIKRGDLLFFDTNGDGRINHVGIYVGNDKMLDATSSHGVMVSNMKYYWNPRFVTARRVIS